MDTQTLTTSTRNARWQPVGIGQTKWGGATSLCLFFTFYLLFCCHYPLIWLLVYSSTFKQQLENSYKTTRKRPNGCACLSNRRLLMEVQYTLLAWRKGNIENVKQLIEKTLMLMMKYKCLYWFKTKVRNGNYTLQLHRSKSRSWLQFSDSPSSGFMIRILARSSYTHFLKNLFSSLVMCVWWLDDLCMMHTSNCRA